MTKGVGGVIHVVWEARYLPFGGVEIVTGASSSYADIRFPRQWFQSEHGLYQNWMRDYDPVTGRHLQADPLGLVDGASVYGYALQNPMGYKDFYGLEASAVTIAIPFAGGVAAADGPFPFGDAAALCIIAGAIVVDWWVNSSEADTDENEGLPVRDSTGKIHGEMPSAD